MTRWWLGLALTAVCLGQGATGRAQFLPNPPSQPPIPEPIPFQRHDAAIPGPGDARIAPCPPGEDLGIPAHIPGAFGGCKSGPDCGMYVHFGATALQRQRMGHEAFAIQDPGNLDTGRLPRPSVARDRPVALDLDGLQPDYGWGPKGTIGFYCDGCVIEFTGFYLPETAANLEAKDIGRLDTFFINPPVGFEGDNGLWAQADRIVASLETTLYNGEINYRYWSTALTGAELILGVRYVNQQERFNVFTDDDGLSVVNIDRLADPTRQATYSVHTRNSIIAPQAGFEYQYCCKHWLSLGWYAKGAWGVNFQETDISLTRGDGLFGRSGGRNDTRFAHMYDVGGFFDLYFLERGRVRLGYSAFWILGVAEAVDQLDFNLLNTSGRGRDDGSVFYHGPSIEVQFLF